MDMIFPHFVRASTDVVVPQPPQKSLLQLVVEAGGKLGLVPQREAAVRAPYRKDGAHEEGSDGAVQLEEGDMVAYSSWYPPTYVAAQQEKSHLIEEYLHWHGLHTSFETGRAPPPLLRLEDSRIPAPLLAGLQQFWRPYYHRLGQPQHQHEGGGGAVRAAKLSELQDLVLGNAAPAATVYQRPLPPLRGIQHIALPTLLLGYHTLVYGPRASGRRTISYLAAACRVLEHLTSLPEKEVADMCAARARATTPSMVEKAGDEEKEEEGEEGEPAPIQPLAVVVVSTNSEVQMCCRFFATIGGANAFRFFTLEQGDVIPISYDYEEHGAVDEEEEEEEAAVPVSAADMVPMVADAETEALPAVDELMKLVQSTAPAARQDERRRKRSAERDDSRDYRRRREHHRREREDDYYDDDDYDRRDYDYERSHHSRSRRHHRDDRHHSRRHRAYSDADDSVGSYERSRDRHRRHGDKEDRRQGYSSHDRHHHRSDRRHRSDSREDQRRRSTRHAKEAVPAPAEAPPRVPEADPTAVEIVAARNPPVAPPPPPPPSSSKSSWLPAYLRARAPVLVCTLSGLQESLRALDGNVTQLQLEQARAFVLTDAERVLHPLFSEKFPTEWWTAVATGVDVDCQFTFTCDHTPQEVYQHVQQNILPGAGERWVWCGQLDESIWSLLHSEIVPVVASGAEQQEGADGQTRQRRLSYEEMDVFKASQTAALIVDHFFSGDHDEATQPTVDGRTAWQRPAVVVCTTSRREQDTLARSLEVALRETQSDRRAALLRLTTSLEVFCGGEAEVLLLTDFQLHFGRDQAYLSRIEHVELLLQYSLPKFQSNKGESKDGFSSAQKSTEDSAHIMREAMAHRVRCIMGSTYRYLSKELARGERKDTFRKVRHVILLMEHMLQGYIGRAVSDALASH